MIQNARVETGAVIPFQIWEDADARGLRRGVVAWVHVLKEAKDKEHVVVFRVEEALALRTTCARLPEATPPRLHFDVRASGRPFRLARDVASGCLGRRVLPTH